MDRLVFDRPEVRPANLMRATVEVERGRRVVLHGLPGTGRTWVADHATPRRHRLYLRFGKAPDRSARAIAQAAAQLGTDAPLRALTGRGIEAGIEAVAELSVGMPVVADDADSILRASTDVDWLDAVPGMLAPMDARWLSWLSSRDDGTLLVARRASRDPHRFVDIEHPGLGSWPIKLQHAEGGFRDWLRVVEALGGRPDRLFFAAAVLPMLSAAELEGLLEDEATLLPELGRAFRQRAGRRARALDVVAALDGVSEAVVRSALAFVLSDDDHDPVGRINEQNAVFDYLRSANLLSVVADHVELSTAARDAGAVEELSANDAQRIATALLANVNATDSLVPRSVATVLAAHELAVRAGNRELALRTTQLHVHGLVELARRASIEKRFVEAWLDYSRIRRMLEEGPASSDGAMRRIRSYVLHYHAWNGRRAQRLPVDDALADSEKATGLWPENARWHGQRIELLLELGRLTDAAAHLGRAESQVQEHPQRARHLRVLPAERALRLGLVRVCLDLLAPSPSWIDDPEAVHTHRVILQRLQNGVDIEQLDGTGRVVAFHAPIRLQMQRLSSKSWKGTLSMLAHAQGETPLHTLDALVRDLSDEVRLLVSTPTPRLSDKAAERKGWLLSLIDVLNSDIGLEQPTERWLLGRIEGQRFLPMQRDDLPEIELSDAIPTEERPGLWFARVPVLRDGQPAGPVAELSPAGSSLGVDELRGKLRALREASAG